MAAYKVIQDVEAEDKILGPLTLKQLIFAIITVGLGFGAFRVVTLTGSYFTAIPFLPFMIVFGALAAPLGKNQPTEVWLAAQIHFLTKPKVRLWDQNDLKEVVKITAPKKEEKQYTDGLSQQQVKSRLQALSSTLDSHGWAVKNVSIQNIDAPSTTSASNDRLVGIANIQQVPEEPQNADIFAPNNTESRELDVMLEESEINRKEQIQKVIQQARENQDIGNHQASHTNQESPQMGYTPPPVQSSQPQAQPIIPFINYSSPIAPSFYQPVSQNQVTPEEQAVYNKILEQKRLKDQEPQPRYNHKVVAPPQDENSELPPPTAVDLPVAKQNNTQSSNNKENFLDKQKQEIKTTNTKNDTIIQDANANAKPKHTKKQQDEVVIKLHDD